MVVGEATLLFFSESLPGVFVDLGEEVVREEARGDEEHDECLWESALELFKYFCDLPLS